MGTELLLERCWLPFCKMRVGHVRSRRAVWLLVPQYNPHSLEPQPGILPSGEASVAGRR
jgi:hypothetical protein